MLNELCRELKNWFVRSESDKHFGAFTISNGVVMPSLDLSVNQYYRIIGSKFNDGVHKFGDNQDVLIDETFDGAIWIMCVPKEVIDLSVKISGFISKQDLNSSQFTGESFGGYSYTKGTKSNGAPITWQDVFCSDLNYWRKI